MNQVPRLFARYKITCDHRYSYPFSVWRRWWRFYLIPIWGLSEEKMFRTYDDALSYVYERKRDRQEVKVMNGGKVFF